MQNPSAFFPKLLSVSEACLAPLLAVLPIVFFDNRAVILVFFAIALAMCAHLMVGRYAYTDGGAPAQSATNQARTLCGLGMLYGLVLWLCLAFLFFMLFFPVVTSEGFVSAGALLQSAVEGLLMGMLAGPVVIFTVLPTTTDLYMLLLVVLLLPMLATGCVLGLRALRIIAGQDGMSQKQRILYTVFLCVPTINLVPLSYLQRRVRMKES